MWATWVTNELKKGMYSLEYLLLTCWQDASCAIPSGKWSSKKCCLVRPDRPATKKCSGADEFLTKPLPVECRLMLSFLSQMWWPEKRGKRERELHKQYVVRFSSQLRILQADFSPGNKYVHQKNKFVMQ